MTPEQNQKNQEPKREPKQDNRKSGGYSAYTIPVQMF
jgi:hypothetical protein